MLKNWSFPLISETLIQTNEKVQQNLAIFEPNIKRFSQVKCLILDIQIGEFNVTLLIHLTNYIGKK